MNIKSNDFSFRKGENNDILQLESCRINSIKNSKIYSQKQINIWINSKTKLGRTNSKYNSIFKRKPYCRVCS